MSVPPEIEASRMSCLDLAIDVVEAFRASGLPVENMARRREQIVRLARLQADLGAASMNLAEVPKWVMPSASA
jgi:hypothetical protein